MILEKRPFLLEMFQCQWCVIKGIQVEVLIVGKDEDKIGPFLICGLAEDLRGIYCGFSSGAECQGRAQKSSESHPGA